MLAAITSESDKKSIDRNAQEGTRNNIYVRGLVGRGAIGGKRSRVKSSTSKPALASDEDTRGVDIRLLGKENSNSHGARPVR